MKQIRAICIMLIMLQSAQLWPYQNSLVNVTRNKNWNSYVKKQAYLSNKYLLAIIID